MSNKILNRMSLVKICPQCEFPFTPDHGNQKFCSEKCVMEMEINYSKIYYEKNRERIRANSKRAYDKNREKIIEYFRKYRVRKTLESFELVYNEILKDTDYIHSKYKLKQECLEKFSEVWKQIKAGQDLKNPYKSGPTFIFLFFMTKGINIKKEVINRFELTRAEFIKTLKQLIPFYKDYLKRDKKKIVFSQINMIIYNLGLSPEFFMTSFKIFNAFSSYLKNIKEELITATVILLSIMKLNAEHSIFYNVCKLIGIKPSSIYNAIDTHIFSKINLKGYTTFKITSEIVRELLDKKLQLITQK